MITASDRINMIIAKYKVNKPQIENIKFDKGIYLCDSTYISESFQIRISNKVYSGYFMIKNTEDGDQRIKGMLLDNFAPIDKWEKIGDHSGDSCLNLIIDSDLIDKRLADNYRMNKNKLVKTLENNYQPTRSWGLISTNDLNIIIGVQSGYGSGGVAVYKSNDSIYLDYSGIENEVEFFNISGEWEDN